MTSAKQAGLGGLGEAASFLGQPLRPTPAEHIDTLTLRLELASPGEPNRAHLGEAETLAIIIARGGVGRDLFASDDDDAVRLARARGVQSVRTWNLLRLAGRQKYVEAPVLLGYIRQLRAESRSGSPGGLHDVGSVLAWIRA